MDAPRLPGPQFVPGQIVNLGQISCVVTAIRRPNVDGMRIYDLITLDGNRRLYKGVPECNLSSDSPLTSSAAVEAD